MAGSSALGFIPKGELSARRDRSAARISRLIRRLLRASLRLSATLRSVDVEHHDQKLGEEARIRVVLADDSVLLREGIASLLERKGFEIVGQSGTAEDLLLKVRSYRPDIAIVDIKMPPTQTDEGLRAAKEIREKHPDTAVLVLSQYVEEGYALELLQDSAEGVGYLLEGPGLRPGRLRRRGQAGRRRRLRARSRASSRNSSAGDAATTHSTS